MKFRSQAMDSDAKDHQNQMYQSQSSAYSFFTQQAIPVSAGFSNENLDRGRVGRDLIRGRFEMRETIWWELEKERIREEIIKEEMKRKRLLEAEVRNELMMEREMAMRRGGVFMPLSRPSHNNLTEPKVLNRQLIGLEEKLVMSIDEKYGRGGRVREIRGFPVLTLILSDSPNITPIPMPLPEDNKTEVIVFGKPDDEIISGTKRKSPPAVSEGSVQSGSERSNKRVKEEWTCAVCQVSTTSERGLSEHIQGKKHQIKEAALVAQRTGANFGLGVAPTKPVIKPLQLALTTFSVTSSDPNDVNQKDVQLALTVVKPGSCETNKPSGSSGPNDVKVKDVIIGKNKRDKFKFWCEMCQVGAFSEAVMNDHKEGKKHSARLVDFYQKGKVDSEASATENTCDTKTETKLIVEMVTDDVEHVTEEKDTSN